MRKLATIMAVIATALPSQAESDGTLRVPQSGSFTVSEPTAQAASVGRSIEGSMDYSTGRATFGIGLLGLSADGIDLPISISYTTGGVKIDEEEGYTGVGWGLSYGGFISRSINGKPDNDGGYRQIQYTNLDGLISMLQGDTDTGADRYTYQAGQYSGEFIIQYNNSYDCNNIVQLPDNGCLISVVGNGFRIVTPDGCSYHYQPGETVEYRAGTLYLSSIIRHMSYGPVTRGWKLTKIVNPQRTDSITFEYSALSDRTFGRNQRTSSYSVNNLQSPGSSSPSLPDSYGQYYYRNRQRPSRITSKGGYVTFTGNVCQAVTLYAPDNTEVQRVELSYTNASIGGETKRMLTGYALLSGGVQIDGATFGYENQSMPMYSSDLFGYCNHYSSTDMIRGILDFRDNHNNPPVDFGDPEDPRVEHIDAVQPDEIQSSNNSSTMRLRFSNARRSDPSYAVSNSLNRIETMSGGLTEIEYEPNTIANGWTLLSDTTDLTIGVRIRAEAVTDLRTGVCRIREFEYSDPVPSIRFDSINHIPFISVGGTHIPPDGLQSQDTYTTGITLLAASKLPGAPLESNRIYYSTVRETVSGTGIDNGGYTMYEYDLRDIRLPVHTVEHYIPSSDLSYCGTGSGMMQYGSSDYLRPYAESMPVGVYYSERIGGCPHLVRQTDYRQVSNSYQPARVTQYTYRDTCERVNVGYHCESLMRTRKSYFDSFEEHTSVNHFSRGPIWAYVHRSHPDSVIVREIAEDGTSRTIRSRYVYNDLRPEIPGTWVSSTEFIPENNTWFGSQTDNNLLCYRSIECGADKVSTTYTYSADFDGNTLLGNLAVSGWKSLPVRTRTLYNDVTTEQIMTYTGTGANIRLASEVLRSGNSRIDSISVQWNANGNPISVSRNGAEPVRYGWTADGLYLQSMQVGGLLTTAYTHKPLVGLATVTLPSGTVKRYEYNGTVLKRELTNSAEVRAYSYGWESNSQLGGNTVMVKFPNNDMAATAYDASGREIARCIGNAANDSRLWTCTAYDALGRVIRSFRPMTCSPTFDLYENSDMLCSSWEAYGSDKYAYSDRTYGSNFDERPRFITIPGPHFVEHPASTTVSYNRGASSTPWQVCRRYRVCADGSLTLTGNWNAGELEITCATDGDGRKSYTYTDFLGRVVLERTELTTSRYLDTYYVYDSADHLRYVLSPKASAELTGTGVQWTASNCDAIADYAYVYTYDSRWRLSSKKMPGCEAVTISYDLSGTAMLTQDGVQRGRGVCSFSVCDACGRQAIVGECAATPGLMDSFRTMVVVATRTTSSTALGGYTVNIPLTGPQLNSAYYYDSYEHLSQPEFAAVSTVNSTPIHKVGLLTGMLQRVLDPESQTEYIASVYYYDVRDRMLCSISSNLSGGYDRSNMTYNNNDKLASTYVTTFDASRTELNAHTITQTYDGYGRNSLTAVHSGTATGPVTASVLQKYDLYGNLAATEMHNGLKFGYGYEVNGAMKTIVKTPGGLQLGILYNGGYSGMATQRHWIDSDGVTRIYRYTYDNARRLTGAAYSETGRSIGANYSTAYTYDDNSCPLTIQRHGLTDIASANGSTTMDFGMVDDITVSYSGNRPIRALDDADVPSFSGAMDFTSSNYVNPYTYDANGRMIMDKNSGVDSIRYNCLGLPEKISMRHNNMNSSIRNIYSADGKLLRRIVSRDQYQSLIHYSGPQNAGQFPWQPPHQPTFVVVDTTDWRGSWRYENGALDRELLPMGYIKDDTTYYYHTDELGNILQVINSVTGGVVQQTHYYPYGAPFGESTATVLSAKNGSAVSPYKFGGKEEVRVNGYQALDFSARYYNRNLGIFTTPDPCQEDYPRTMPMLYCLANPVNLTDPTGMIVIANSREAQDMIRNTIPEEAFDYLIFDEKGVLDAKTLSLYVNGSGSQNFSDLLAMASNEDYTFEVYLKQTFEYLDQDGIKQEYTMDLEPDLDTNPGMEYCRTGEWGFTGHTNLPGLNTEYSNSTTGNIQLYINPQLSIPGRSQMFCHEGYGHGYLYMFSGGNIPIQEHRFININGSQFEMNFNLSNRISRAIGETVKFMSK